MSDSKQPVQKPYWATGLATLSAVVSVMVALSYLGLNWRALTQVEKRPIITVENRLALPIIITINESTAYTKRLEPGAQVEISLLSDSDFPARVHWEVIRHRDGRGRPLGELLYNDYRNVDKERILVATNVIGLERYFYPILHNNTDHLCEIVLNDGLSIEYLIGASNAHAKTNLTGYFKLAKNSNIAMYCPHQTYWEGERFGKRGNGLKVAPDSGIVDFYIQ